MKYIVIVTTAGFTYSSIHENYESAMVEFKVLFNSKMKFNSIGTINLKTHSEIKKEVYHKKAA